MLSDWYLRTWLCPLLLPSDRKLKKTKKHSNQVTWPTGSVLRGALMYVHVLKVKSTLNVCSFIHRPGGQLLFLPLQWVLRVGHWNETPNHVAWMVSTHLIPVSVVFDYYQQGQQTWIASPCLWSWPASRSPSWPERCPSRSSQTWSLCLKLHRCLDCWASLWGKHKHQHDYWHGCGH